MDKASLSIIQLDPEVQKLLRGYMELFIGGKPVVAPYYMNEKGRKGRRVSVGKGTPIALERETMRLAKKYNFDLNKASAEHIRDFMVRHRLGIDCSGLVAWAMYAMVKGRTGRSLWKNIWLPGPKARSFVVKWIRPVENISARILTHENNAAMINNLREVRPGDIIRSLNGNHVLLVEEVAYDARDNLLYLQYVNSTEYGGIKYGVRKGRIYIKNPDGHILEQKWVDSENDINWIFKAANDYPDDTRVVRLKFLG